jgi:hypothetical protein
MRNLIALATLTLLAGMILLIEARTSAVQTAGEVTSTITPERPR